MVQRQRQEDAIAGFDQARSLSAATFAQSWELVSRKAFGRPWCGV